ncbi:CCL4 protein, partial [Chordeiles acutipennis]|nr:CCL4 protein [Chordeiles acutipennis]
MKVFSLILLTLLLLAALWTGSQGISFRSPGHSTCCYKEMFVRQKIPASLIRSYQMTPSHCSRKAVRVELRKTKVCVNPEEDWFQQYLRQKESTNTST